MRFESALTLTLALVLLLIGMHAQGNAAIGWYLASGAWGVTAAARWFKDD